MMMLIQAVLLAAAAAAVMATPFVALCVLAHCGRRAFCWALALTAVAAGMTWGARGFKEAGWRTEQSLQIRRNVMNFSDQYDRLSKLGDEALRHDYVTNFCGHACTLLNYSCKQAPNTSNLVERYYRDWDGRIGKAESTRK